MTCPGPEESHIELNQGSGCPRIPQERKVKKGHWSNFKNKVRRTCVERLNGYISIKGRN
jgi:hypothetical protein